MEIKDVVLYFKKYKGSKVAFNSRKGVGRIIEGIVVQVVPQYGVVVLRDNEDFPHCVSLLTLKEI
jgi:ribosomal protein L35AE/L33A